MSIWDYHPIVGPMREMSGKSDDNDDVPCGEKLPCGLYNNGKGGDTMCGSCGYSEVGVGETCELCGGTGIDKYSEMPGTS